MASTTGTALGTIQTSCLPFTARLTSAIFSTLTVSWPLAMEAVGLIATLTTTGMPLLMPPSMPPALLVAVTILPSLMVYRSLFSDPLFLAAEKPAPNSTPLTAGIASRALAKSPSKLSKTGSPRPAGTLRATLSIIPPRLSFSSLVFSINRAIFSAASWSAHQSGFFRALSLISVSSFG